MNSDTLYESAISRKLVIASFADDGIRASRFLNRVPPPPCQCTRQQSKKVKWISKSTFANAVLWRGTWKTVSLRLDTFKHNTLRITPADILFFKIAQIGTVFIYV